MKFLKLKTKINFLIEKAKLNAAKPFADKTLGFISLIESIIFPIPVDPFLAGLTLAVPKKAFKFALFCTIGSVIGGLIGWLLGYFIGPEANSDNLWQEMTSFDWDRKYYCTRRNKVLNKHARANVCFGNTAQPPDYPNRKGTIIGYDSVPILNSISNKIPEIIGDKGKNLVCEGNRYFDLNKCGIGWHGDKERRKVIAFRLGATMKLCYHWHYRFKPVGKILEIDLNDGDMYLMSEKAVGTDWGSSAIYTLRHAAGPEGSKYLKLKE